MQLCLANINAHLGHCKLVGRTSGPEFEVGGSIPHIYFLKRLDEKEMRKRHD